MGTDTKKKRFSFFPRKLKGKYNVGEKVYSSSLYECSDCENYTAFKKGEVFSRCEDCNGGKDEMNSWYVTNVVVHFMSKNLNIEFDKISSLQTRIAVKITELAGTMSFVYFHIIWFLLWISANQGNFGAKYVFDPFPYGLLTMVVSLEAIFLSTIIMIGQNILSQQSELRSELDYQVNLKTEKEVAEISAMIRELKEDQLLIKDAIMQLKEDKPKYVKKKYSKKRKKKEKKEKEEHEPLEEAGIYIMDEDADDKKD